MTNMIPINASSQTWLPQNRPGLMPAGSTNSTDSIISQMPLPYHLPQIQPHFSPSLPPFNPPHQNFAILQQQAQNLHIFSPLNPNPGFEQQQKGSQSYQDTDTMHPSVDRSRLPQITFPPTTSIPPHEHRSDFMQSQLPYQGEHYSSEYHQGMSQYSDNQRNSTGPHEYASAHGGRWFDQHNMGMHQTGNPYPSSIPHDPGKFFSYNRTQSLGNSDSRSIPHHPFGQRIFEIHNSSSSGDVSLNNEERIQNYQHTYQSSQYQKPGGIPPWGQHYRFGEYHDSQRDTSPLGDGGYPAHAPIHVLATEKSISPRTVPADVRDTVISSVSIGSAARPKSKSVATPSRRITDASHVPPSTAPPQLAQNSTPTLRSRKGQSISILKIDPIRGPPPAFWPASNTIGSPANLSSPKHLMLTSSTKISSNIGPHVQNGSDPFTDGHISTPSPFLGPTLHNNPYGSPPTDVNPFFPIQQVTRGLAPMVLPEPKLKGPSQHLASIANFEMKPSIEVALDDNHLPFVETARLARPVAHGVVRVTNIPYAVTRAEIMAFFGRNARIVNESEEPIHIIMERVTSKTMEAYIEFINMNEAVSAVNRYEVNRLGGRSGRLGERHVDLEVSGQEQLMTNLFPKARNVRWVGARPEIMPTDLRDPYNSGFKGFVTREELVMLVKHVETPQRSPFSKDCPQRPFECLISTITKYPWYMVDFITLEDRDLLFYAARDLVQLLVSRIENQSEGSEDLHINSRLLRRVRTAVLRCHGFTEQQKDDVAFICGLGADACGLAPFADHWSVFKVIGPKPGIEQDVLWYYMALLREATTSSAVVPLAERAPTVSNTVPNIFGNIIVHYPQNVKNMTLGYIAKLEWNVIERLLRTILMR